MKKLLILIISSCCSAQSLSVRVVTEDLPPYQFLEHGKLQGSSVILVEEMLKRANINSPIEVLPWARAFHIASTQSNVIIFSMARNQQREADFYWLLKIRSLMYHFYRSADQQQVHADSLTDVLQHTVVAVRNSYEANSLQKLGFQEGKNLVLVVNYAKAWQMLLKRHADYTYANELVESTLFKQFKIKPIYFVKDFDLGETANLYIAASITSSTALIKKLTLSLQSMQQDGTLRQLSTTAQLPRESH